MTLVSACFSDATLGKPAAANKHAIVTGGRAVTRTLPLVPTRNL